MLFNLLVLIAIDDLVKHLEVAYCSQCDTNCIWKYMWETVMILRDALNLNPGIVKA